MAGDPLLQLLDAAREGDDVAMRELVRQTQPAVWRLCAALGSAGEEDDLVQETYLRALRGLAAFRGDSPVQPWLLSIARRVCADHVRRRVRQRRLIDRIGHATVATEAPLPDGSEQLLAALSDDRREAFVLTQVVGLSYEDAALVAGCPVGTIRSRVARARSDLLAALQASDAI
ncbi:MAG: sigma-70 family RNA polymerase sigma factor [Actinobacteria bacterium]|nr:sigma-70 family RNA polymerase sigma factor [Actinomycetota bacterium]